MRTLFPALRRTCALLLAFLCLFACLFAQSVFAIDFVETEASCTLTVQPTGYSELSSSSIPVTIYRVADIDKHGKYSSRAGFGAIGFESVSSTTTAQDWNKMASDAMRVINSGSGFESKTGTISGGSCKFTDLQTGLYLVNAQGISTLQYTYSFTPYLISLPDHDFDYTTNTGDDSWSYDETVGLKPSRSENYTDFQIEKTLDTYNASLGPAVFVFHYTITTPSGEVFDDVVSLNFSEAGTRSVTIDRISQNRRIPAGSSVTVTEVYSGSSYEIVGGGTAQLPTLYPSYYSQYPNRVFFENDYDEGLRYGDGVVNSFRYNGTGWEWVQPPQDQLIPKAENQ